MDYYIKYKRAGVIIEGRCSLLINTKSYIVIKINQDINKVRKENIYEFKPLEN